MLNHIKNQIYNSIRSTICLHFGNAQTCLTTPNQNNWQFVCEILYFKRFCIFNGQEKLLEHNSRTRYPSDLVFVESYKTTNWKDWIFGWTLKTWFWSHFCALLTLQRKFDLCHFCVCVWRKKRSKCHYFLLFLFRYGKSGRTDESC